MCDANGFKYHDHIVFTGGFFIGCTGYLVDYSESSDWYSIKLDIGDRIIMGVSSYNFQLVSTQRRGTNP